MYNSNMVSSEYHRDQTIVYSCKYHVVFCPKYRRKVLVPPFEERLKSLIFEKQEEYGYRVILMEMMPDHVHLLLDVDPQKRIDAVVRKIRGFTSYTLRKENDQLRAYLPSLWTRSRFRATVGAVSLDTVKKYIEEQKET